MKIDVRRSVLICSIVLLFLGASIVPGITEKITLSTNGERVSSLQVISHPATREEINTIKQRLGVYDPTKNYNILIDGHGTGLAPPTEKSYEHMVGNIQKIDQVIPPAPLIAFFDLSTDPCFPQVGDQGQQGSCAAWAATYYCSGYVIGKKYNWDLASQGNSDQLLSPAWTYNKCNGGRDRGSFMDDNMVVTQTVGCSRMSQMPYNPSDAVGWGTEAAWRDAPSYRANTVYEVPHNINTIKTLVSSGYPITFALDAYSYSYFGSDNVLGSNVMLSELNHGNTIVGYDDAKQDAETGEVGAFKIVNSWGYWGPNHNGYYWMTYQAFLGSWNYGSLNYIDCLYVPNHPTLLGVWLFNPQPYRSASVELGIGPYGSPLETRVPWWDGSSSVMHNYPSFMCLDITEFYDKWAMGVDSFYLKIGDAAHDGTITSFKVEYYNSSYVPGNPTRVSLESPNTPKNTPGYVTASIQIIDNIRPYWRSQGESATGILRGTSIILYAQGKDNVALQWATLATNETGTWQNVTGNYGSPMNLGGVYEQWVWSNFTWQNPAVHQDKRIGWKIYYTDGSDHSNVTNVMSFIILPNPVITDHTASVATTGEAFTFNVSILEDHGIAGVWVEYWFGTGVHTNVTMIPTGVDTYYERTITIPAHSLDTLYYIISAKDGLNYWSSTGFKQVTVYDNDSPQSQNQRQNQSFVPPGGSVILSAQGKDNVALDWAWLSTDESGDWLIYSGGDWWNRSWAFSKQITINHTKVADDLTNFPVLISISSDADLAAHAQPDGDDLVFVDKTNTTQFAHEIESYNSVTGQLVAWVNVPFVSSSQDTILYMYYGNPSCNNQENVVGTWDVNYLTVHHMVGATWSELDDSTMNHWDVSSAGGNPSYNQPGEIGKCVDFDPAGGWDYLKVSSFQLPADSTYTGSAWVYVDGSTSTQRYIFEGDAADGISLCVEANEEFLAVADTTIDDPAYCYSTTSVDVSNPQWIYVCTRADATTNQLDLFVNGINEGNDFINGQIKAEPTGLNIGTYMHNNNYYMNGKIDELRVSNVPRADAWILTEYRMMSSPTTFISLSQEVSGSGGVKYGSPLYLGDVGNQWMWSNFTWQNPAIPEGTMVGWRLYYLDSSKNQNATDIMTFKVGTGSQFLCGDVTYDHSVNVNDVVYLINYLFVAGSPEPVPMKCVGDVNGDGVVNVNDVVYLINYLFVAGSPAPGGCC